MKKALLAFPVMLALGVGVASAQSPTYPPTGSTIDRSATSQSKGSPTGSGHDRTGAPSTNAPDLGQGSKRDLGAAESSAKARASHKRVKPSSHDRTGADTTPANSTVPGAVPTRSRDVRTGVVDKSAEPQSKGSPSGSGHDRDMTGTAPPSGPAGQGR